MTALLQRASTSGHPVYLRFERRAGHAGGTQMKTITDRIVDDYTFLFDELGVRF
jgi:prolyl oligopeptidase PreP (S9A serine peptidase family)